MKHIIDGKEYDGNPLSDDNLLEAIVNSKKVEVYDVDGYELYNGDSKLYAMQLCDILDVEIDKLKKRKPIKESKGKVVYLADYMK